MAFSYKLNKALQALQSQYPDLLLTSVAALIALISAFGLYSYTVLLEDTFTQPLTVSVHLDSKSGADSDIRVRRLRFLPEFARLSERGRNTWQTDSGLTRDIRIEMPESVADRVHTVEVLIGEKRFTWDKSTFESEWSRQERGGRTGWQLPDTVRYSNAVLPYVSDLRNVDFDGMRTGVLALLAIIVVLFAPAVVLYLRRRAFPLLLTLAYPALALMLWPVNAPPTLRAAVFAGALFAVILLSAGYASMTRGVSAAQLRILWKLHRPLLLLIAVVLSVSSAGRITGEPIENDAAQNTRMAYNLFRYGVLSVDSTNGTVGLTPTNYREPFPPIVHAAYLWLHPGIGTHETASTVTDEGRTARNAKGVNAFWGFIVFLGTGAVIMRLLRSPPLAALSMYWVHVYFVVGQVDRVYTELQAAALLLACALTAVWGTTSRSKPAFFLYGLSLGLLVLTKATFLYVGIVAVVVMQIVLYFSAKWTFRDAIVRTALITAAAAAVVTPWMVRNYQHFGHFEVTQRGGLVLLVRAHKSNMTDVEWNGSFYAYAPSNVRPILARLQGWSPADLESGGSLERIVRGANDQNDREAESEGLPAQAVSYYRTARAERVELRREFAQEGMTDPGQAADEVMKKKAISMILSNPVGHIRTTLSFAWRGIWAFEASRLPGHVLNFLSWLAMIAVVPVSLWRRDVPIFVAFLLPFGMVLFHAAATHSIARYNAPAVPFMVIAVLLVLQVLAFRIVGRIRFSSKVTMRSAEQA